MTQRDMAPAWAPVNDGGGEHRTTDLGVQLDDRSLGESVSEVVRDPVLVLDRNLRIVSVNAALADKLLLSGGALRGRELAEICGGAWLATLELRATFERARAGEIELGDLRVIEELPEGRLRTLIFEARRIPLPTRHDLIVLALADVTSRRHGERYKMRLLDRMLAAQNDERERLAQELHDETGQGLSALLVALKNLEDEIADASIRTRIEALRGQARTLLDDVGRLARGIHPTLLAMLGLTAAVRSLAQQFTRNHGVPVEVDVEGRESVDEWKPGVVLGAYRVVQEALTNVAKHACASRVRIRIEYGAKSSTLRIDDDGVGFSVDPSPERGIGLLLMQSRVEQSGGSLTILSHPGRGTTVEVELPRETGGAPR